MGSPGPDSENTSPHDRWLDLAGVIILSVTTILTAWTAFQSTKWSGVQANSYAEAGASRAESTRASNLANQQVAIDVAAFIAYAEAIANGEANLAEFLEDRLRDEFKPAFEAWLATEPLDNEEAPPTPFQMAEYRLTAARQAEALLVEAEQKSAEARDANQRADNYVATTVLFAAVLFFIGISTKFNRESARIALTAMGVLAFIAGVVIVATFPIEV